MGVASLVSKILPPFHLPSKRPKFPFRSRTIVHGGQKIESAQKFMQVEIDVKCMETKFDEHGFSGFGDFAPFVCLQKRLKFPFGPWTIVHGGQKIESAPKIHAIRG